VRCDTVSHWEGRKERPPETNPIAHELYSSIVRVHAFGSPPTILSAVRVPFEDDYQEAAAPTLKVATLLRSRSRSEAQWGQLHSGLSGYADYLGSEFASPTDAETKGWFEDIRLGCERARALGGP
jgi:hypothetical protein